MGRALGGGGGVGGGGRVLTKAQGLLEIEVASALALALLGRAGIGACPELDSSWLVGGHHYSLLACHFGPILQHRLGW